MRSTPNAQGHAVQGQQEIGRPGRPRGTHMEVPRCKRSIEWNVCIIEYGSLVQNWMSHPDNGQTPILQSKIIPENGMCLICPAE